MTTLERLGFADRLHREGVVDVGLAIRYRGGNIQLDLAGLTGRRVMIYGQQELVKDLVAACVAAGDPLLLDVPAIAIKNRQGERPTICFATADTEGIIECDFVAGCDGLWDKPYRGSGKRDH